MRGGGRRKNKIISSSSICCCLMAIVCFLKMIPLYSREDDWATNGPNELRWWRNASRTCIKEDGSLSPPTTLPMAIAQCNNKMMRTEKKKKMFSNSSHVEQSKPRRESHSTYWRKGPQRIETERLGGPISIHGWISSDEIFVSKEKPVVVVEMNKTLEFFPTLDFHLRRQGLLKKHTKTNETFREIFEMDRNKKGRLKNKKEKTDEMPPAPVQWFPA